MLRYGRDYGRWNGQGRYDWERPGGYSHGMIGGPRNDDWGVPRHSFPGEGAWMGEATHFEPGYDYDYGGGFGSGYSNRGGDYFSGRGGQGYGGGFSGRGGREMGGYDMGSRDMGGRETGWGGGQSYGGYETGGSDWSAGRGRGGESGAMNMRAAELMTDNPETVSPDTTLAEVAQKMRDLDVGIIPVVDDAQNRRLRGVITDRDITIRATAEGKDARNTKVSEVMTSEVSSVNKNDPVRNVLSLMQREQVKRVPVTDREGRLVGIIAEADLLNDFEGRGSDQMVEQTLERVYEQGPRQSRGRSQQMESREQTGMRASGAGNTAGTATPGTTTGRPQRKGSAPQE